MKISHYKLSVLLSIILLSLATFFYIYTTIFTPHGAYTNSSAIINGIGGGNITGDCQAGKKALPIYCVQTDKKQISISFDAAWGADDTIQILDVLDKHNVKTTFFMTGGWVSTYPDMVKEIYSRGHDLGNHSENHKQMSKLDTASQKEEIMSVHQKIEELTGYNCFLFRPPYGDYNSELINTIYGCNHYPVQWDVDSLDWKDYGVENIIKTVTTHKALGNGSIGSPNCFACTTVLNSRLMHSIPSLLILNSKGMRLFLYHSLS